MKQLTQEEHAAINALAEGRWSPELPEQFWQQAQRHPTPDRLRRALNCQWQIAGVHANHLEHAEALIRDCGSDSALLCRLASCALILGDSRQAIHWLSRLLEFKPPTQNEAQRWLNAPEHRLPRLQRLLGRASFQALRQLARHPQLQNLLSTELPQHHWLQPALAQSPAKLLQARLNQPELLNSNSIDATIAVVGNAPLLQTREHGVEIDDADVVIRFNRIPEDERWRIHVGSRCDIVVLSPGALSECPPDIRIHRSVILSGIEPLHRAGLAWRALVVENISSEQDAGAHSLGIFEANNWYELVATLQAPPSAGLLMLNALRKAGRWHSTRLFGFSALDSNAPTPDIHNHLSDGDPASGRHNWLMEAQCLRRWQS